MPPSAEMARELGAVPRLRAEPRARCCASCATTAARRTARLRAMRRCHRAGAARPASCPDPKLLAARQRCLGRAHRAGRAARLSQCAGHGDRADRHDRPRDGLRHHRHRARLRAGQIQEARRRRLFQDHQPHGAEGLRALGYDEAEIEHIVDYAVGHGTLEARPASTRRRSPPRASPPRIAAIEKALAAAFDIRFVFNKWTLGEAFCTARSA